MPRHPIRRALAYLIGFASLFFVAALLVAVLGGGPGRSFLSTGEGYIALVPLQGEITRSDEFVETLGDLEKDAAVAAVIVRIDSPGGSVAPSQEMYDAVRRLRETKPVVASLGAVAASGGYYVASAADVVVANPGSLTGSIGVILSLANVRGLLEKVGVEAEIVTAGAQKDMGSPFRKPTPEERALFKQMADDVHAQFLKAVAEGRGLSESEMRRVSSGRIFTGEEALEVRLVDSLGGLHEAVLVAAERAGLEGEPRVETVVPRRGPWWWRYLVTDEARGEVGELRSLARFLEGLRSLVEGAEGGAPLLLWRLPLVTSGFRG